MTITVTNAASTSLIVPPGTPLKEGKLYLQLYHGRKDPAEQMDGWGFTGPTFGPLECVVQTYVSTLRLHGNDQQELWLDRFDDMIVWQGSFYGDMSIFIAEPNQRG